MNNQTNTTPTPTQMDTTMTEKSMNASPIYIAFAQSFARDWLDCSDQTRDRGIAAEFLKGGCNYHLVPDEDGRCFTAWDNAEKDPALGCEVEHDPDSDLGLIHVQRFESEAAAESAWQVIAFLSGVALHGHDYPAGMDITEAVRKVQAEQVQTPSRCDYSGHEVVCSGFTLTDCMERNREHPDTFEIPFRQELDRLEEGRIVKLIVEPTDSTVMTERMWFEIVQLPTAEHPGVAGCVSAACDHEAPVDLHDQVVFEWKHVADIYEGSRK